MRNLFLFISVITIAFSLPGMARAQESGPLVVNNLGITYEYGSYLTFQSQININIAPTEAFLLFKADGDESSHIIPIKLDEHGNTFQRYDMSEGKVKPFSTIRFHYRLKFSGGVERSSDEFVFQYEDNRFKWQVITGGKLTIHWYEGGTAFGQDALDAAQRGIKKIQDLLLVEQTQKIDIYIYANFDDLDNALKIGDLKKFGDHAAPELRLGLIDITSGPEQVMELGRKVPHELAHILTYDLMGERYFLLPEWLREGIAVQAELSSNPDFSEALIRAAKESALLPMNELCKEFPPEAGRHFLASAESASFTGHIIDKFGQTGVLALIGAYGSGLDCKKGMQQALGRSLDQVDAQWKASELGENTLLVAVSNLFPYIAILLVILAVSLINVFSIKGKKNGK